MDLKKVFTNNNKWIESKLALDQNYFKKLGNDQNPDLLYIGCSDSRVAAEDIVGLPPGDVFVHRNIANMVINTDLNLMSVVNYAVEYLKVKHIVVCGHFACSGVKAAMQSEDMGILNPWLNNIRDVYRIHKVELNAIEDEDKKYDRLVELNVQEQCVNLIKTAVIQKERKRGLKVHGWVFDIHSGKLIDLKIDFNTIFNTIMDMYHLEDKSTKELDRTAIGARQDV